MQSPPVDTDEFDLADADEFDDAVTTALADLVKRAFGDNEATAEDSVVATTEPGDVATTEPGDVETTEAGDVESTDIDDDPGEWTFVSEDAPAAESYVEVLDVDVAPVVEPEDDPTLEPGYMLSDWFEIVELVHTGGMGHIYKAVDHRRYRSGSDEFHVAIKIMRTSVAPRDEVRLVLEREAAKAQTLSHPNIINIFDFDEHEDQFFLVMEWLDGESVNDLLKRTRGRELESDLAWSIIEGTAAALQHAHSHNVVHADINPANIFITDDNEIKLLDFGVARYFDETEEMANKRFAWVTQTYASPEVLSGMPPVFEDDVFSLGCLAYRLLSGKHPFGGSASIFAKQLDKDVQPISGLAPSDWQALKDCLAYERTARPAVDVLIRDTAPEISAGNEQQWFGRERMLWPAAAVVAAIAIVIGVGGWWLSQVGAERAPSFATTDTESAEPGAPPAESAVAALLSEAGAAMDSQSLVEPEGANARALFRRALEIEPGNPSALRGLRDISDTFVQQANEAMLANDPVRASAALAVAAETDAGNPAIAVSRQLVLLQGNRVLADARFAAVQGDLGRAAELLSRAEAYAHIDENAIRDIRSQITQGTQEDGFLARLATAETHISRGQLISPTEANAQTILSELSLQYGDDPRLLSSMERLGERLLTRAAFATAAARFTDAGELLDAVEALGVLTSEVTAARASLQSAMGDGEFADATVAGFGAEAPRATATAIPAAGLAGIGADSTATPLRDSGVAETGLVSMLADQSESGGIALTPTPIDQLYESVYSGAAGSDAAAAAGAPLQGASDSAKPVQESAAGETGLMPLPVGESGSGEVASIPSPTDRAVESSSDSAAEAAAAAVAQPLQPKRRRVEDLGLQSYVAPVFPRNASRRGITGFVDIGFHVNTDGRTSNISVVNAEPVGVFDASAEKAVSQWRFEPQDDVVRARVTLRFELPE